MEKAPAELMKEYVNSQKFTSTTEIMEAMKAMFGDVLQQVMEAELDTKLGYEKSERTSNDDESGLSKNYRNGHSKKTVKTQLGEVRINVPRDRNGEYEPSIISKYSRNADGMEEKILSLYSCGMSQRDISEQIKNLYDVEISPELVSKISEKIMPEVTAWQNRPLNSIYPFVFMDAIHYKVKENHQYVTKAAYVVLGINMDGCKDILGIWIGEHESAKFWLNVLNDLKNRGVQSVYVFCVDGLNGFPEAISAVYPKTEVQQCIIHQIRNSTKYVSYKDIKALMADLKKVYAAVDEETALYELEQFATKWDSKYPKISASWKAHWSELSTYFKYPQSVRTLIYTTNSIENFNRQLRKVSKNRSVFPNDDSLLKMLYLAQVDITRKWTGRRRDWGEIHSQLEIFFADRLPE